jgi:hypothetical protein
MANEKVEVNGRTFTLRVRHFYSWKNESGTHCNFSPNDLWIAVEEAKRFGQIKKYRSRKNVQTVYYGNGFTVCHVEDENRNVLVTGYSFCGPLDQFNKKVGRHIAIGRGMRELKKYLDKVAWKEGFH